jgi:hypothetical protein
MEDVPPLIWSDGALRETLEMLASPSEAQLAYLKKLGTYPSLDELALEFDYEYGRLRPEDGRTRPLCRRKPRPPSRGSTQSSTP